MSIFQFTASTLFRRILIMQGNNFISLSNGLGIARRARHEHGTLWIFKILLSTSDLKDLSREITFINEHHESFFTWRSFLVNHINPLHHHRHRNSELYANLFTELFPFPAPWQLQLQTALKSYKVFSFRLKNSSVSNLLHRALVFNFGSFSETVRWMMWLLIIFFYVKQL